MLCYGGETYLEVSELDIYDVVVVLFFCVRDKDKGVDWCVAINTIIQILELLLELYYYVDRRSVVINKQKLMSPFGVGTGKADQGESSLFDLQNEYHNAIDRLVQWELVLKNCMEQLGSKDEKIRSLEEHISRLSLEIQKEKEKQEKQEKI